MKLRVLVCRSAELVRFLSLDLGVAAYYYYLELHSVL
jgi:hypothetical protein